MSYAPNTESLLAYRKKHFALEVKPTRYPEEEGEIELSVTRNGQSWQSLSLLRSEAEAVIKALTEALK